MAAPYKANLFANQEYCDVIMNAVTEAKKNLQDTQVELDKKRSRYINKVKNGKTKIS